MVPSVRGFAIFNRDNEITPLLHARKGSTERRTKLSWIPKLGFQAMELSKWWQAFVLQRSSFGVPKQLVPWSDSYTVRSHASVPKDHILTGRLYG